jgi:hypothetical protein
VRFSITAVNTEAEVEHAIGALKAVRESLNTSGNGAKLASPQPALMSAPDPSERKRSPAEEVFS